MTWRPGRAQEVLGGTALALFLFAGCNSPGSWKPSNPFARAELGTGAEEMRAAARKEKVKPGPVHLAYARWQEQIGNLVEARDSYELALNQDPRSAEATLGLARLDQLAGRTQEAEQRFLKAARLAPGDARMLDALGQFYVSQQRWKEAIDTLHEAYRLAPNESSIRYDLAVALARSGNIDAARPHFVATIGEPESHYNIGYILHEQGRFPAAERELVQAVMLKPELEEAQALLDDLRGTAGTQVAGRAAGTERTGRYEELPPSPDVPTAIASTPRPAERTASRPRQTASFSAPAPRPDRRVMPTVHQPDPSRTAAAADFVMPAQGTAPVHSANAGGSAPSEAQLEQMRNQLGTR